MTSWDPRETIAAKRDRQTLPPGEVERFVLAYATGEIADGPAAAFLMASLLNGLDDAETLAMTRAMIASGDTVTFGDLGRPTVDKHSTGGVADGVTLIFAPLAAALGLAVAAQTSRLVPADGALYALRDATATVPSVPLIAASVMSKKLAVDSDLILLDVKAG